MDKAFRALRKDLAQIALEWESKFGIAPAITSAISEYDAATLLGYSEEEYSKNMNGRTAVSKGHDIIVKGKKYQIKANRPSGKKGSKVTLVAPAKNFEWDKLVWILYNEKYVMQEAWEFDKETYKKLFFVDGKVKRISPYDMRKGKRIYPV